MSATRADATATEYPILVAEWTGDQPLAIVCERCGTEAVIGPDDLLNEGLYECPADTERARRASTDPRCRGSAVMKYEQADQCPNCKALGFYRREVNAGCCSRSCMLQAEYAATLARG